MKNVYIYCEGQTEEAFIQQLLYPYFIEFGIAVIPIICGTKRARSQKGGVSSYAKIKHELIKLCRSHRNEHITTMFDYYGMPDDTPGITSNIADIYDRIASIEAAVNTDLNEPNCRFHFMLHEFEAVLFSRPESFALIADDEAVNSIRQIRASFASPEHINNSPDTAPSKRIEAAVPMYAKIRHGSALSLDMGLSVMLEECPHFRSWIEWIKSIAN